MKGIKNQYNTVNLEKYRKIAMIAADMENSNSRDVSAQVMKPGRIGPNGVVKIHVRPYAYFEKDFSESLSAALAFADDVTFGMTESKSEIVIALGVLKIVSNWDESKAEELEYYRKGEPIE